MYASTCHRALSSIKIDGKISVARGAALPMSGRTELARQTLAESRTNASVHTPHLLPRNSWPPAIPRPPPKAIPRPPPILRRSPARPSRNPGRACVRSVRACWRLWSLGTKDIKQGNRPPPLIPQVAVKLWQGTSLSFSLSGRGNLRIVVCKDGLHIACTHTLTQTCIWTV